MIVNVWLMHKAGADRVYTSTVCPDRAQLDAYKRDGFEVFCASVFLPTYGTDEVFPVNAVGQKISHEPWGLGGSRCSFCTGLVEFVATQDGLDYGRCKECDAENTRQSAPPPPER